MTIDGRTRPAGVVGWPIDHTLSPAMHNAAYEELGLNWVYLPFAVPDQGALLRFADVARSLPFVGFNVTMPYKQAMLELCDEVAMLAQMAGAVNAVHCSEGRLIGYNTDSRGLLESLAEEADFSPEGKRVVLLGAGGAAGAAVASFILGKAAHLTIVNRDVARAEALKDRAARYLRGMEVATISLDQGAEEAIRSADLVVNATSLGMKPDDESPMPVEWLHAGLTVYDMVYCAAPTALLEGATAHGARAVSGLGMLVAQGALAIDIWAESAQARAPRAIMRAAAEQALLRDGALGGEGE